MVIDPQEVGPAWATWWLTCLPELHSEMSSWQQKQIKQTKNLGTSPWNERVWGKSLFAAHYSSQKRNSHQAPAWCQLGPARTLVIILGDLPAKDFLLLRLYVQSPKCSTPYLLPLFSPGNCFHNSSPLLWFADLPGHDRLGHDRPGHKPPGSGSVEAWWFASLWGGFPKSTVSEVLMSLLNCDCVLPQ